MGTSSSIVTRSSRTYGSSAEARATASRWARHSASTPRQWCRGERRCILCSPMHDSPLDRPAVADDGPGVAGSPHPTVPVELRTPRVLLRPWRDRDAEALRPILEANQAHIAPWIPERISMVVSVPELAARL